MELLNKAKTNYIVQVLLIEAVIAVVSGVIWTIYMRRRIVMPIRQLNDASLGMVEHLEDGTAPEIVVKMMMRSRILRILSQQCTMR